MPQGYVKEQFEDTPGYEGATVSLSTKTLYSPAQSVENAPEPSVMERDDELRGVDEPLEIHEDEHNPTWSRNLRAYPDTLGFDLTHVFGPPVTTAGDGIIEDPDGNVVPVGAHLHEWEAPHGVAGPDTLTTDMVIGYVDEGTFVHVTGCGVDELTLNTDDAGGVKLSKKGPALFYEPIVDPALTPTPESLAIRPFMRRGLQVVTWQGNVHDLDQFNVTVTNPLEYGRSLGVASGFPSRAEKGEGPVLIVIEAPKRHNHNADIEALMRATRFAVKALYESQSTIAATGYRYRLWIEGDGAQYTGGGPEALENKRRIGASFTAKLTTDGTGASSKFSLVNATASYDPTA